MSSKDLSELERRLAKLKGVDTETLQKRLHVLNPSAPAAGRGQISRRDIMMGGAPKSQEDEVNDLLFGMADLTRMDVQTMPSSSSGVSSSRLDPRSSQLASRLQKLNPGSAPVVTHKVDLDSFLDDEMDEDLQISNLLQQVSDSIALEEATGIRDDDDDGVDDRKQKKKGQKKARPEEPEDRATAIARMKAKRRQEDQQLRAKLERERKVGLRKKKKALVAKKKKAKARRRRRRRRGDDYASSDEEEEEEEEEKDSDDDYF